MNKRWRRVEVHGESMAPTLLPGDRLLVVKLPFRAFRVGSLVAVRTPERVVVKRVAVVHDDGRVDVAGDNTAASTDYRGVRPGDVVGRVVYRYWPSERVGRVN